jgi:hypothetical protein
LGHCHQVYQEEGKEEEENLMEADDEGWVTVTKSTKKKVRNRKRKRIDGGG